MRMEAAACTSDPLLLPIESAGGAAQYEESYWTMRVTAPSPRHSFHEDPLRGPGTVPGSMVTLVGTCIGTGLLSMPFALARAGTGLGLVLLAACAAWSGFTSVAICRCCDWARSYSYEEVVLAALGHKGSVVMEGVVVWLLIGAMTGGLVVARDSLAKALGIGVARIMLPLLVALVVAPLSCTQSMSSLRYSNAMAVTCTVLVGVVVMVRGVADGSGAAVLTEWPIYVSDQTMLPAVPLVMLSFGCQVQVPPVYGELDFRSLARMKTALAGVGVACFCMYGSVGVFGLMALTHLGLGESYEVPGNLLDAFPSGDSVALGMRAIMAAAIFLVYPLLCVPCRSTLDHLLFGGGSASNGAQLRHGAETVVIVCVTFALAVSVDDLAKVNGVTGATAGALICYVLPLVCFLRLRRKQPSEEQKATRVSAALCAAMLTCMVPLSLATLAQE